MPEIAYQFNWTFASGASTGPSTDVNTYGYAQQNTFEFDIAGATNATVVKIQSARSSGGPWADLVSTTFAVSTVVFAQLTGPYEWLRANLGSSVASAITVRAIGSGG